MVFEEDKIDENCVEVEEDIFEDYGSLAYKESKPSKKKDSFEKIYDEAFAKKNSRYRPKTDFPKDINGKPIKTLANLNSTELSDDKLDEIMLEEE